MVIRGEFGVLKRVLAKQPGSVHVIISLSEADYFGVLYLNAELCDRVVMTLGSHIGKTIAEVAALEIVRS